MIAMFEKNYLLSYRESYTCNGNLHHCGSIIERYQYSMSIDRAFELLLSQNNIILYLFLQLDVLAIVSIMLIMGVIRYLILMQETNVAEVIHQVHDFCALLEVASIQSLVQYFQTIHSLADNNITMNSEEFRLVHMK